MAVAGPSLPTSPSPPARTACRTQLSSQTCLSTNHFRSSNHADLFNSRRLILLQALCRCEKTQLLWIQANPNSLCKTRRVAHPLRELLLCTEGQKGRSVSLLLATLTHSVSRKSFPCHSYENTRDGGTSALSAFQCSASSITHPEPSAPQCPPLFPVSSFDCAHLPSPGGVRWSPSLSSHQTWLRSPCTATRLTETSRQPLVTEQKKQRQCGIRPNCNPRLMLYIAIQCRETPFRERFGAIKPTPVD